jgi:8-oxo-dGTP diphosphatase
VLLVGGRYALQLRDDKPGIVGRGLWGLFGGALADGETPASGLRRELYEELSIRVADPRLLWTVDGESELSSAAKRWWFFEVDATDSWAGHVLHEGQAARLFDGEEAIALPMARITRDVLMRHSILLRNRA